MHCLAVLIKLISLRVDASLFDLPGDVMGERNIFGIIIIINSPKKKYLKEVSERGPYYVFFL